ncbi:hypothetical protein [Bacillus pseudomycoides]|uniref:hypothetical protein n=1 Tax=Bacillus pseudomycoides TaxID=64104 RepID=UPI001FB56329|nr:hypothetical protein [Bacillus pseudomycoides]
MNNVFNLYYLIKNNLIRQMRSYPFLIVIGLTIFLGYACVPAASSGYEVFYIGGVRGEYNSYWLGGMGAMLSSLLLWLFGFYMLRSQVTDDQRLGVGQLIASSPISNLRYIFSKTISNFVVLLAIETVLIVAFIIMQFIRGEDLSFQIGGYLYPILYIVFPSLALLAALTTFFDVCPGLKGVIGNIVFFFLWVFLGIIAIASPNSYWDVFGLDVIRSDMLHDAASKYEFLKGSEEGGSFGYYPVDGKIQTFQWDGVDWNSEILLTRFMWFGVAILFIVITAFLFKRFNTSHSQNGLLAKVNEFGKRSEVVLETKQNNKQLILTSITRSNRVSMLRMLKAELLLMLKGFTIWWYVIAIGLIAFGLLVPLHISKSWLPLIMIWPIAIWSQMITREKFYHTDQIIISSCSPFYKFFSTWISGIIVSFMISSGLLVKFILSGETEFLISWLCGIVFIPTLALALGIWSGSRKLFEVIYMLWWYLGPVNDIPYLDFLGLSTAQPMVYLALSVILLCVAIIGQQQKTGKLFSV